MTELKWGQTPFDLMTHDELLLTTKRLYSALVSARSVLSMSRSTGHSIFWSGQGSGGRALEKSDQALDAIHEKFSSGDIYGAYFRYADDLLFEPGEYRIGHDWAVCPLCGKMFGGYRDVTRVGERCNYHFGSNCKGVLRPLEWGDLEPGEEQTP